MRKLYKGLNEKSFKKRSAILLPLADIIVMAVLYFRFTSRELMNQLVLSSLRLQYPQLQEAPTNLVQEMLPLVKSSLFVMFSLIFCYHLFVFYKYQKESKICAKYVHFYTLTAVIGSVCFACAYIVEFPQYSLAVFLAAAIYAYNSFAPKELKTKTEAE